MADGEVRPSSRSKHPERLGRYRILKVRGRGAMGVVYEAQDEVMGRLVGLKVLMADLEGEPDTLARFHREAKAAARLVHPNIITIYDAGEEDGRSFIAMQLLDGWPLAEYLKRPEAASLERQLDLMIQVCDGLAAAHSQGVVHRDLKPNNLIVQTDGLVKIFDFGVARLAESSMTQAGTMIGTPDYMSPEQARGAQVDVRSDIFSAGAVFYFILTGHKPFPGPELPAVLHQLQHVEPAPMGAHVPPDLAALVLRALAKDAAARPQRVEELLTGLVRFRRQYQAETRRLATTLRSRLEAIGRLAETVESEARAAGLPLESDGPRVPEMASAALGGSVDGLSVDRGRVTEWLHEIEAERQRLTTSLEHRRAHVAQLEQGRQLLAAGDARGALKLFRAVAAVYPSAQEPQALVAEAEPRARQEEERQRRLAELLEQARQAIVGGDWSGATRACESALALSPGHEQATALLGETRQAIAREQRRQEALLQRHLDRAGQAIARQDFADATAALDEAERLLPESPAVGDMRRRLVEAEAAAEAAELLRQMSGEEIRRARAAFRRGRADEAVQQLRAFLDAEPDAALVVGELNRLVRLRERAAAQTAARQARTSALLSNARALADQHKFGEALGTLRDALRIDPTLSSAAALFDEFVDRDLAQRVEAARVRAEEIRQAQTAPLLAAARDAVARGYLAVAFEAATAAQHVGGDQPEIASLLAEIRRALDGDDAETASLADSAIPEVAEATVPAPPAPAPPVAAESSSGRAQWWRRRSAKS